MGTLADTIIPLMGSVSMEKAETVRKACDGLEKRIEELERATTNTGEETATHEGADTQGPASAPPLSEKTSSPAPSASEIPAWVPSVGEIVGCMWIQAPAGGFRMPSVTEIEAVRRLIASRAPRASTVSVEEMAERLYEANRALPTWERNPSTCELTQKARDYFRSLARSALSALSASEAPRGPANGGKDFHGNFHGTLTAAPEAPQPSREDIEWMNAPMGPQPSRAAQLEYTVGCDQCEKLLSKVEHHPSGIIICKECGGDSTRAAQPAPASTPPIRAVAGTSLACAKCGCRWKRHADGSFQLYDADQRPCVECDNAPNSPLRPETPDDAPASTPDEGEVETPVQPIVTDKHGVTRFKANAIVAYIVDWCARKNGTVGYGPDPDGPAPDLSEISRMAFSRDDRVQLAQLIGYSLSGFEELGYVESADVHRALRLSSSRTPRVDVRRLLVDAYVCVVCAETVADMTAALKSQGVECVGEKESAA